MSDGGSSFSSVDNGQTISRRVKQASCQPNPSEAPSFFPLFRSVSLTAALWILLKRAAVPETRDKGTKRQDGGMGKNIVGLVLPRSCFSAGRTRVFLTYGFNFSASLVRSRSRLVNGTLVDLNSWVNLPETPCWRWAPLP